MIAANVASARSDGGKQMPLAYAIGAIRADQGGHNAKRHDRPTATTTTTTTTITTAFS